MRDSTIAAILFVMALMVAIPDWAGFAGRCLEHRTLKKAHAALLTTLSNRMGMIEQLEAEVQTEREKVKAAEARFEVVTDSNACKALDLARCQKQRDLYRSCLSKVMGVDPEFYQCAEQARSHTEGEPTHKNLMSVFQSQSEALNKSHAEVVSLQAMVGTFLEIPKANVRAMFRDNLITLETVKSKQCENRMRERQVRVQGFNDAIGRVRRTFEDLLTVLVQGEDLTTKTPIRIALGPDAAGNRGSVTISGTA